MPGTMYAYQLPRIPYRDPLENHAHGLFANYLRDAYLHGARCTPRIAAHHFSYKSFVLATRILDHGGYGVARENALRPLTMLGLPPERELRLLVDDTGSGLLSGWLDGSPVFGGGTGSFADLSRGQAVVDGERQERVLPAEADEDSRAMFRLLILRPYALFLLAMRLPALGGTTDDQWLNVHWAVLQNESLFPTLSLATHPLEAWAELFSIYHASDLPTQAQLVREWGSVKGLLPAILVGK